MEGEGAGKDDEVNSPLQQKESTAKSGCATKDQDAGLPGKSDRDAQSAKARRYVAREGAMPLEEALVEDKGKVETRGQKLEWEDTGLPGKGGRTQKARKRAATWQGRGGGRRRALKRNGPSMFLQKIRQ